MEFIIGYFVGAIFACTVWTIWYRRRNDKAHGVLRFIEDNTYLIGLDDPEDVRRKKQIILDISQE